MLIQFVEHNYETTCCYCAERIFCICQFCQEHTNTPQALKGDKSSHKLCAPAENCLYIFGAADNPRESNDVKSRKTPNEIAKKITATIKKSYIRQIIHI